MISELEDICRHVYVETGSFYEKIRPQLGSCAFGFKILYGPPVFRPPILFLGYQPGGSAHDDQREQELGVHKGWPRLLEYSTENWHLARVLRQMLGEQTLVDCMGLNAIFLRSSSLHDWNEVPKKMREESLAFCLPQVTRIVEVVQPHLIVAIGMKTLNLFCEGSNDVVSNKGRSLIKSGTIAGYPALGTLHLTGAHISSPDRLLIAERIRSFQPSSDQE